MKTNLGSIEVTDDERDAIANLLDGKDTRRLATRKEITAIAQQHIGGLARKAESDSFEDVYNEDQGLNPDAPTKTTLLYEVDEADPLTAAMAHPEDPSYVRGWNQVKQAGGK